MQSESAGAEIFDAYLRAERTKHIEELSVVIEAITRAYNEVKRSDYQMKNRAREVLKYYISPVISERRNQLLSWGLSPEFSTQIDYNGAQYIVAAEIVETLDVMGQLPKVLTGLKTHIENYNQ